MKKKSFFVLIVFAIFGCQPKPDLVKGAQEIRDAEAAFEKLAKEKSIAEAFYEYAAEDATINRGQLIHGRDSIHKFYINAQMEKAKLNWSPDSVFVSDLGDLGYTYGKYKLVNPDSTGNEISQTGIFHTVWRKQKDGRWKYVWD
ncbi:MAG: YybH family protein [Cyclobacteriaceae bacterium]